MWRSRQPSRYSRPSRPAGALTATPSSAPFRRTSGTPTFPTGRRSTRRTARWRCTRSQRTWRSRWSTFAREGSWSWEPIQQATGGVIAGYGNWRAIELLVEAGLSPVEAIKVATSNGARLLGIARETGSIEPGKAADLVVVDGNPAEASSDLRKTETVFKDGMGFDSKRLFESVSGSVGIQ